MPSYIPFALVNGDSKTFGRESMCSARLLTARARGEKSASVKKSWWHRGLNDTRDGPVSRRALGRGVRIRGLRLRTSGAAGPCAAAIINGVVGAREQSVAHQTEPRVDVQVRERSRRASGDAGESRRECDPTAASPRCNDPRVHASRRRKTGLKRAAGVAMTGAGASSDIVSRHANRVRRAVK